MNAQTVLFSFLPRFLLFFDLASHLSISLYKGLQHEGKASEEQNHHQEENPRRNSKGVVDIRKPGLIVRV